uniref:Uncharacterized protein n=1 Tax=Grammatophora oceanica TaxID=210454 RepID=A0A7S1VHB6_9STRA|mmetsp:Transcript_4640/g.6436  ORF Transcript_4640/g.6436 Transcript_4640/m.6436 type:complete len:599 (+) Transcript_4640:169-1965(+)|eukprot:CAMPEP_0194056046 /NCGR_PEP_ID=MMETSP0009_2-20130614/58814_1 /TAXON_ID=210454 /ORGANISM="Grammatophora oceanica, Strain CCMP 410" /LENGTH=598 /DNA_ID=CAMNT_0038705239 /DNA_START=153 /DNA_END=1949 /DNA_ORIENTATION=-
MTIQPSELPRSEVDAETAKRGGNFVDGRSEVPVLNFSEEQYHDSMRLGDSPYYGGSGSSGDDDGAAKSSLDVKVPPSSKGQNHVTIPKDSPETSGLGAQQKQAAAMTTPTQKNPLDTEGEIYRHMFARQQQMGDDDDSMNSSGSSGRSSRSKSSSEQYPPHLKTMMADGVPVTQWIILLVLLSAALWQLRKAVIPDAKTMPKKKESAKGSKLTGKQSKGKKRGGGKKMGNGVKRATKASKPPDAVTTDRELIIEEPKTVELPAPSAPATAKASKAKSKKKKRQKQKTRKVVVTEQQQAKKDVVKSQENSPDSVSTDESSSGTAAEAKPKPPMNELDVPQPSLIAEEQDAGWETVPSKSSIKPSRIPAAAGSPQSVLDSGGMDSLQGSPGDGSVEEPETPAKPEPVPVVDENPAQEVAVDRTVKADTVEDPKPEDPNNENDAETDDIAEPKPQHDEAPVADDTAVEKDGDAEKTLDEAANIVEESDEPQQAEPTEAPQKTKKQKKKSKKKNSRAEDESKLNGQHNGVEPTSTDLEISKERAVDDEIVVDDDAALALRLQAEEEKLLAYEKQQEKARSSQQDTWEEVATKKKKKSSAASS